jgi:hypothetical protein
VTGERTVSFGIGGAGLVAAAAVAILALGLAGVMAIGRGTSAARGRTAVAAAQPVAPSGSGSPEARVGQQALRLVSFDPGQIGYHVAFRAGRRDIRAQIDSDHRSITIYVSPGDALHRVAHDVAHELGHAYDARYLSPQARGRYLQLRGRASSTWFPGFRAADYTSVALSDYGTGSGDFAEVFALCHSPSPEFRSTLAPVPADPCALIPKPA